MNQPHENHPSNARVSSPSELLAAGDARWTGQARHWQERQLALPWPRDLLQDFCLRMSARGMCVSQAMMLCDRRYALQQLAHAHSLGDDELRRLAVELFRHDETRQQHPGPSREMH